MSEKIANEEYANNNAQCYSFYKSEYENMETEVKNDNGNSNAPNESNNPQEFLRKPTYGRFEVKVKKEVEFDKDPIKIAYDEIKPKEENVLYDEPTTFTGESYPVIRLPVKHELTQFGEESYQCSLCNKVFSQNKQLRIHMSTHTAMIQNLNTRPLPLLFHTTKSVYNCSQCHNNFSQKHHLVDHLMSHTGEKPYQCYQCDKAFSQKNNLIDHQRVHTGEKPHQCNQCDKAFSQNSNLIKHQRTHTGDKPYQCTQCDKAFSLK
ncbi:unnamed protein product, partial [Meganyctiphanes norvegica]